MEGSVPMVGDEEEPAEAKQSRGRRAQRGPPPRTNGQVIQHWLLEPDGTASWNEGMMSDGHLLYSDGFVIGWKGEQRAVTLSMAGVPDLRVHRSRCRAAAQQALEAQYAVAMTDAMEKRNGTPDR